MLVQIYMMVYFIFRFFWAADFLFVVGKQLRNTTTSRLRLFECQTRATTPHNMWVLFVALAFARGFCTQDECTHDRYREHHAATTTASARNTRVSEITPNDEHLKLWAHSQNSKSAIGETLGTQPQLPIKQQATTQGF